MRPARVARPLARGDLVLTPFPFTDLRGAKLCPGVVLWSDAGHDDVGLAFVTSRPPDRATPVTVPVLATHPEFAQSGLQVSSWIRTHKQVTLTRGVVRRWLGRLGPLLLADLDRALVIALGINLVPYREEGRREERARLAALYAAGGSTAVLADLGVQRSLNLPGGRRSDD